VRACGDWTHCIAQRGRGAEPGWIGDDAADFVLSTTSMRSVEAQLKGLERANSAMEMDIQSNQRQIRDLEEHD
jgi:hypothetical protein